MSKIDQGPGASSFECPSKVGWLYKHGGSGVSSHWRKRWFVADHHYLFYYKGPNDKKPVGIVCLPDYESCHKAEAKIWKKQHSFMLDRGNTGQENDSSEGAPVKNYVLYAESEEEMLDWIKALTEEIKPMIGEDRYANGFSGGGGKTSSSAGSSGSSNSTSGGSSKGKGKKGKGGGEPGVDDKALDKVTALAGEGPKLTHLTASRPKVPRGRRPPKRYAVFHEDDSRPEESPPATPDVSKPSEPSPTSSPSPSDSPALQKKKGHKPTVALLPNRAASVKVTPKTPPIPPAKIAKADSDINIMTEPESPRETTQKLKFARPAPPKKPVKEKPLPPTATIKEEVPTEAVPSPEPPSEAPVPVPHTPTTPTPPPTSQRPPTPPIKPSKEKEPTTAPTPFEKKTENFQQQQQPSREDDQQTKGAPRPSPVRRQRPQPPVKPRTNTMASTGSAAAVSGGSVETVVAAAPPTGTQIAESAVFQPPQQQQRPVPAKRPVPRKRVVTPQQSPSREIAPPSTVAAAAAVTKETAALPKELQDQVKKEPPVPAKEMKPQAAKEMVVSEREGKAEPEREEVKTVTAEELLPPKEPEIPKKEGESAAVKEEVLPEREAKPETPVMATEKDEKLLVEGKVDQAVLGVAVEKPQEKEEKLPPTPFDDIEEIVSEPEKINIEQEGQKQLAEGESGKKDADTVEQKDDSKYVYEDMEPDTGEKGDDNPRDEKATANSEYEIMNFDEEEKVSEKESAIVTGGGGDTTEEVARQQQQRQAAPGKVHQYDQVALDEAEPRFKISSSSSKDFDGTLSSSSGYEHMNPAPAVIIADDKEREPSVDGEYVPMKDGVIIDQELGGERDVGEGGSATTNQTSTDKYEYEEPCEWVEKTPPIIRDASPPYDTLTTTRLTPSPGHGRSDELAPDADVRRSVASSTGSVSSQKSLQTSSLEVKGGGGVVSAGEERGRGSSGASRKSIEAGSSQLQPERDGHGYAKVNKNRQPGAKDERVNSVTSEFDRGSSPVPPEIIPMAVPMEEGESPQHTSSSSPLPSYRTVPETLRQAKEVLRLAQVVKAEAEQMRQEARKELNIAKKDRHEAMLLKKNAAEILRMAKERLNSVGAKSK